MKKIFKITLCLLIILFIIALSFACGYLDSEMITMAVTPTVLLANTGIPEMPGMKKYVLFIPEIWCKTVPTVPKPTTIEEISCVAEGAFSFRDGKKPIYIDCSRTSVGYNYELQGELGTK